jgi:tetratricopeptide (TPR) repeat protein
VIDLLSFTNDYYGSMLRRPPWAAAPRVRRLQVGKPMSLVQATALLSESAPMDLFYDYSVRQVLLHSGAVRLTEGERRDEQRRLMFNSWHIGEYEETVATADTWLLSSGNPTSRASAAQRNRVLIWRAKAFRNLGRYDDALSSYREALSVCERPSLGLEKAFTLLMIGKMYGNYLNLGSTFSLFITRALQLLRLVRLSEPHEREDRARYVAICEDSLGQLDARSDGTWQEGIAAFARARSRNEKIGNTTGISRNLCHIAMARSRFDPNTSPETALALFKKAIALLPHGGAENRALGHRKIQIGALLERAGRREEARSQMEEGLAISQLHRDHRSFVRGCIALGRLHLASGERTSALQRFLEAKDVAARVRLEQYELDVNRALAQIVGTGLNDSGDNAVLYLRRNKEILESFQGVLLENVQLLRAARSKEAAGAVVPEFRMLTHRQQVGIYDALIRDYSRIATQLNGNFVATLDALTRAGDIALVELATALTRVVSHELKPVLPRYGGKDTWARLQQSLQRCAALADDDMPTAAAMKPHFERLRSDIDILYRHLAHIQDLQIAMQRSRSSVAHSLLESTKLAITRIEQLNLAPSSSITFDASCDVILPCERDWIVSTVYNLLRNAIENSAMSANCAIEIAIREEAAGDITVGNDATVIVLDVSNEGRPRGAERVLAAQKNPGTFEREGGTGLGLFLANIIFCRICQATADAYDRAGRTHVTYKFKPDGVRVKRERPS